MASNTSGLNTHAAMTPELMRDIRHRVQGRRQLGELSSLDSEKQPNLILAGKRAGSSLRQQGSLLRSSSLSSSQSSINSKENGLKPSSQAVSKENHIRSSQIVLPRIPSKTLKERVGPVINKRNGQQDDSGEGTNKVRRLSSSRDSQPSLDALLNDEEPTASPVLQTRNDINEVSMRRKGSSSVQSERAATPDGRRSGSASSKRSSVNSVRNRSDGSPRPSSSHSGLDSSMTAQWDSEQSPQSMGRQNSNASSRSWNSEGDFKEDKRSTGFGVLQMSSSSSSSRKSSGQDSQTDVKHTTTPTTTTIHRPSFNTIQKSSTPVMKRHKTAASSASSSPPSSPPPPHRSEDAPQTDVPPLDNLPSPPPSLPSPPLSPPPFVSETQAETSLPPLFQPRPPSELSALPLPTPPPTPRSSVGHNSHVEESPPFASDAEHFTTLPTTTTASTSQDFFPAPPLIATSSSSTSSSSTSVATMKDKENVADDSDFLTALPDMLPHDDIGEERNTIPIATTSTAKTESPLGESIDGTSRDHAAEETLEGAHQMAMLLTQQEPSHVTQDDAITTETTVTSSFSLERVKGDDDNVDDKTDGSPVIHFPPPPDYSPSLSPNLQTTRISKATSPLSPAVSDSTAPDSEPKPSGRRLESTSSEVVLRMLDSALAPYASSPNTPTSLRPTPQTSLSEFPDSDHEQRESGSHNVPELYLSETGPSPDPVENCTVSYTLSSQVPEATHETDKSDKATMEPAKPEVQPLKIEKKKKGNNRGMKPVTKYEGSVKTVRKQIKPGHVGELREIFSKKDRKRRRRTGAGGSLENDDDDDNDDASGSGYSTTSSDNEYDVQDAERVNSPDYCSSSPFVSPLQRQYAANWEKEEEGSCSTRTTSSELLTPRAERNQPGSLFEKDSSSPHDSSKTSFSDGDAHLKAREGNTDEEGSNSFSASESLHMHSSHTSGASMNNQLFLATLPSLDSQPDENARKRTTHTERNGTDTGTQCSTCATTTTFFSATPSVKASPSSLDSKAGEGDKCDKPIEAYATPLSSSGSSPTHLTGAATTTVGSSDLTTGFRQEDSNSFPFQDYGHDGAPVPAKPSLHEERKELIDANCTSSDSPAPSVKVGGGRSGGETREEKEGEGKVKTGMEDGAERGGRPVRGGDEDRSTGFWSPNAGDNNSEGRGSGGRHDQEEKDHTTTTTTTITDKGGSETSDFLSLLSSTLLRGRSDDASDGDNIITRAATVDTETGKQETGLPNSSPTQTYHLTKTEKRISETFTPHVNASSYHSDSEDKPGTTVTASTDILSILDDIQLDSDTENGERTRKLRAGLPIEENYVDASQSELTEIVKSDTPSASASHTSQLDNIEVSDKLPEPQRTPPTESTASIPLSSSAQTKRETDDDTPTKTRTENNDIVVRERSNSVNTKMAAVFGELSSLDFKRRAGASSHSQRSSVRSSASSSSASSQRKIKTTSSIQEAETSGDVYLYRDSGGDVYVMEDITDQPVTAATTASTTAIVRTADGEGTSGLDIERLSLNDSVTVDTKHVDVKKAREVISAFLSHGSNWKQTQTSGKFQTDYTSISKDCQGDVKHSSLGQSSDFEVVAGNVGVNSSITAFNQDSRQSDDLSMSIDRHSALHEASTSVASQPQTVSTTTTAVIGEESELHVQIPRNAVPVLPILPTRLNSVGTVSDITPMVMDTPFSPMASSAPVASDQMFVTSNLQAQPEYDTSQVQSAYDCQKDLENHRFTSKVVIDNDSSQPGPSLSRSSQDFGSKSSRTYNSETTLERSRFESEAYIGQSSHNRLQDSHNVSMTRLRKASDSSLSSEDGHTRLAQYRITNLARADSDKMDRSYSASTTLKSSRHTAGSENVYDSATSEPLFGKRSNVTVIKNVNAARDNTSFSENDSQYGSQASKTTSVDDASPTEDHMYRIVRADKTLSSSSPFPVSLASPPDHGDRVLYRTADRTTRSSEVHQQREVDRSHQGLFRQVDHTTPDLWRADRFDRREPDINLPLLSRSLSSLPRAEEDIGSRQFRVVRTGQSGDKVQSSSSDSGDDSGVEGGKRYRTVSRVQVHSPKKRSNSTGSLRNANLSLRPRSRSPPSREYRVSKVQRQSSWEQRQEELRDTGNSLFRVTRVLSSEDLPQQLEETVSARLNRTWSPRDDENDSTSQHPFRVVHTEPTERVPMHSSDGGLSYPHRSLSPPFPADSRTSGERHRTVINLKLDDNHIAPTTHHTETADQNYKLVNVRSSEDARDGHNQSFPSPVSGYESDMDRSTSSNKLYTVNSPRHGQHQQQTFDGMLSSQPGGRRYAVNNSQTTHHPQPDGNLFETFKSRVVSPPPSLSPTGEWHKTTIDFDRNIRHKVRNDSKTMSPLQQQQQQHKSYVVFNSLQNVHDVASDLPPIRHATSHTDFIPERQFNTTSPLPTTFTNAPFRGFLSGDFHVSPERTSSLQQQAGRSRDEDPAGFRREVYEERSYHMDRGSTHVMPEADLSMEEKDLRVLRGKILIQNRMDESRDDDDFLHNMNVFDNSFHLGKDNPLYQSDPDIYKSLEDEQKEKESHSKTIGQEVTQDITWETVDRIAKRHKSGEAELSPKPRRKQNLSTMLLSKLASIDSKDIRQNVDVQHHNEEIYGDVNLVHADGSRAHSANTSNFDSVNENVELMLKQGKAFVIVKVIAERIVPVDYEFNVWRKSQAIVTRNIEIDLHATAQRRRLYEHVMETGGKMPGALEGDDRRDRGSTLRSPGRYGDKGEDEHQLSSLETLRLFSQILDVAEKKSDSEETEVKTKEAIGRPVESGRSVPASAMDLLY